MMRMTSLEERCKIMTLAQAGKCDQEIAQAIGWKLSTVRKWRRRSQRAGRAGLATHLGRPVHGAMYKFAPPVVAALRTWREAHPGWGATTLRAEAEVSEALQGQRLPSRATIGRWLKAEGLVRRYERHRALPQPRPVEAEAAHTVWEMDARGGEYVPGVGMVMLINLNDRFSHVKLQSFPCLVGQERIMRHPDTADYQLVLRLTFTTWGRPAYLAVDRDSVYYDNSSHSPFPTRLHLWLIGLGVHLLFGPPGIATERGMTERSHQLWAHQVLDGQQFDDWSTLWQTLQQRRTFLNEHLPCRSTSNQPPLVAHPQARWPLRPYQPDAEAQLFDLTRIAHFLAQGQWFRQASNIGVVQLGGQTYWLGKDWPHQQVQIAFEPTTRMLSFTDQTNRRTLFRPIKGLDYPSLADDMHRLDQLLPYQLALPFTWDHARVSRLIETCSVTT